MAMIGIIDLLKQAKNRKLQLTLAAVNGFEDMMHAKVNIDNHFIYSDLSVEMKNARGKFNV